ncbi:MAG: MarR family transcriptional regulator [Lachnospiraceae bacterium]|nr:MarR family transcriptional regulator [Lachnospiraceae bacterium]
MSEKERVVQRIREFNRFYMPMLRLLDNHYLGSEYTPTEARVLFEIYENDGCNAAFIAKVMNIDKSYLSRIIRSHEKKGYLIRAVSEADSRSYHLHLTESGLSQTKDFIQKSNQQIGDIIKPLRQEECTELMKALNTATAILENCSKAE